MALWAATMAAAAVGVAGAAEGNAASIDSIGLPIILIVALVCAVVLTRDFFRAAFGLCSNRTVLALVASSVAIYVLSLFIFVSPGWAHAAVCAVLSHVIIGVVASGTLDALVRPLLLVTSIWFAILIGVPSPLSGGIVAAVSRDSRATFPQLASVTTSRWLVFVQVASTVNIGLTAVQIIALLGSVYQVRTVAVRAGGTVG